MTQRRTTQHSIVDDIVAAVQPLSSNCFLDDHCGWIGPGHSMAFGQDHIASAYPETWRDMVVESVSPGGWVTLTSLDDETHILAWNHSDLASALAPGDPVSVNAEYHVLAASGERFNVLVA